MRGNDYVVGFMFNPPKDHVLLILKAKPNWQRGKFNGIGGKIEEGESPLDAIVREFKEEAGLETNPQHWTLVVTFVVNPLSPLSNPSRVHFFKIFSDQIYEASSAFSQTKEKMSLHPISDLPGNVLFNLRWLIPLCLDYEISNVTPIIILGRSSHEK